MTSKFPRVPGITLRASGSGPLAFTAEAVDAEGVAGTASLTLEDRGHEWRATVGLSLAPETDEPMVAAALLRWAEVQSQTMIQRIRAPLLRAGRVARRAELVLCVDNPPEDPATLEALEAAGLKLTVAEDEMTRPTANLPAARLPSGMEFHAWDDAAAPLFHRAYFEAFRDRPGFPGWDEARWRSAFATDAAFRPDLSFVILEGTEPVGFAVLWVEDETGWVMQMGVRPEWRGKGLGEALLAHAIAAFAAEGLPTVALEVATNNPAARALYERMGFVATTSYRSWRKKLS